MSPVRVRRSVLILVGAAGLAISLPVAALALADVPAGKEVIVLDRIPGKTGKVRFGHADHVRRFRRPDGSPIRCRDCHHTLATDDPPTPLPVMRCSFCHAGVGEPARVIDGKAARPLAGLKPDGALDHKTILFHDSCRACHKQVAGRGRKLAECKTCHERGVSSESLHGRFDAAPQPGTSLSWMRCLAGQRWTGSGCEGPAQLLPLAAAASACPAGFRLPARAELLGLLSGCRPGGTGPCKPCGRSAACAALFGDDQSMVWLAPAQAGGAQVAELGEGLLRQVEAGRAHQVRCVQASPGDPR